MNDVQRIDRRLIKGLEISFLVEKTVHLINEESFQRLDQN